MFIENTEPRVHCIADLPLKPNQKPSEPGQPPPPSDALLPGMNEVDDKVWNERAMKIPLVQYLVDKGVLVPHTKKAAADIVKMAGAEAIAVVKATFDKALLLAYQGSEKRKAVLDEIETQIDRITPKEPKKSE